MYLRTEGSCWQIFFPKWRKLIEKFDEETWKEKMKEINTNNEFYGMKRWCMYDTLMEQTKKLGQNCGRVKKKTLLNGADKFVGSNKRNAWEKHINECENKKFWN